VSSSGGIVYDKLHACYFCNKLVTNIWRHYESVYDKKLLVKKICALPKTDSSRAEEIARLRLLGDYHHNLNVLCSKRGQLIVVRRPRSDRTDHSDFLSCTACKGFFLRTELWRHCKSCLFVEGDLEVNKCQKDGSMLIAPVVYSSVNLSSTLSSVLSSMKRDDKSTVAKNNTFIFLFGGSSSFKISTNISAHAAAGRPFDTAQRNCKYARCKPAIIF